MKEDDDPAEKEAILGLWEKMRTCEIFEFLVILKDTDFRAWSPEFEPGFPMDGSLNWSSSQKTTENVMSET